jgi:hypothetical protein
LKKICNKYGSIIIEKTNRGDYTFKIRDENGNFIRDRKEARKKHCQIYKEDIRLAREELLDLLCNRYDDINLDVIEALLERIGVRLYYNGSMLDFYEVFTEIAYTFKYDTESDDK